MLSRPARTVAALAAVLAVTGIAGGCGAARPRADGPAATSASTGQSIGPDPLAAIDATLDAVEQDLDAAASDG